MLLLKVLVNDGPDHLMEVGGFRGSTALLIAQHMPEYARLVTVDRASEYGEAYRGSEQESRIDRRVGETSPEVLAEDARGTHDLSFPDAGHFYEEVK
jgi:predicted O-methyltransferase YrrM